MVVAMFSRSRLLVFLVVEVGNCLVQNLLVGANLCLDCVDLFRSLVVLSNCFLCPCQLTDPKVRLRTSLLRLTSRDVGPAEKARFSQRWETRRLLSLGMLLALLRLGDTRGPLGPLNIDVAIGTL